MNNQEVGSSKRKRNSEDKYLDAIESYLTSKHYKTKQKFTVRFNDDEIARYGQDKVIFDVLGYGNNRKTQIVNYISKQLLILCRSVVSWVVWII